jgi:hypothetical protein
MRSERVCECIQLIKLLFMKIYLVRKCDKALFGRNNNL